MAELKCYAIDVPFDMAVNDKFLDALKECDGLVGVSPDADRDVVHALFHTINTRNDAYKKLKKYGAVIVANTAYVDI